MEEVAELKLQIKERRRRVRQKADELEALRDQGRDTLDVEVHLVDLRINLCELELELGQATGDASAVEALRRKEEGLRREKELRLQQQLHQLPGQPFLDELLEKFKEAVRAELADRSPAHKKSVGWSSVTANGGTSLLSATGLLLIDGNEEEPLTDWIGEAQNFDFSQYPNEDAGLGDLLRHHQRNLELCGVEFKRGGYKMYDLHKRKSLTVTHEGRNYTGGFDGGVAPFGLFLESAERSLRVAFQAKQSGRDKATYAQEHGGIEERTSLQDKPLQLEGQTYGQALASVCGALALGTVPCILDVTDGRSHFIFEARDTFLYCWKNVEPARAYPKLAAHLKNLVLGGPSKAAFYGDPSMPAEVKLPMKRARDKLIEEDPTVEQLSSLLPFARSLQERHQLITEFVVSRSATNPMYI